MLISAGSCVKPHSNSASRRIRSIQKYNDLIGNRTCDLPARSVPSQPTPLPLVFNLGGAVPRAAVRNEPRWEGTGAKGCMNRDTEETTENNTPRLLVRALE
jgi:hypothetical protein